MLMTTGTNNKVAAPVVMDYEDCEDEVKTGPVSNQCHVCKRLNHAKKHSVAINLVCHLCKQTTCHICTRECVSCEHLVCSKCCHDGEDPECNNCRIDTT